MKSTVNIDDKEVSAAQLVAAFLLIMSLSGGTCLLIRNFWCNTPADAFGSPLAKKVAVTFIAILATKALVEVTDIVADFIMSRAKPAVAKEPASN